MSRKLTSAALALALAGGVYFAGGTAQASNMGFKLERSFSFVQDAQNVYFVSFPLFNGLGDVADDSGCMDFNGGLTDGEVDATDILCELFTSRDDSNGGAAMTIQKLDTGSCQFVGRTMLKTGPTSFFVTGSFTDDMTTGVNREIGYAINVTKGGADPDLENRAVIVGSHDPSFGGHMVDASSGCQADILNVPYHTMYRTANEILCGLEGVDWMDGDGNGNPDTCDAGLFDPTSGVSVTAQTFSNDTGYQGRSVFAVGGNPTFIGTNFDLTPGDAYVFNMNTGYGDRLWLPPHF